MRGDGRPAKAGVIFLALIGYVVDELGTARDGGLGQKRPLCKRTIIVVCK